jgi:hypothetical protein
MLLALTILVALVAVANYAAWGSGERLDEGLRRFETLLLMARSDAANLGRKVRLEFASPDDDSPGIRLLWEPRPLEAPEEFVDYSACTYLHHVPDDLVSVIASRHTGDSAYDLLASDIRRAEKDESDLAAVTFYPDGTCDSAQFDLASTAPGDPRIGRVTIDGATGAARRFIVEDE